MSIHLQVVEWFMERGDLEGCDSTHTVRIEQNELTGRMEAKLKRSIAHKKNGTSEDVTDDMTLRSRKEVEHIALSQYERALALAETAPDDERDPLGAA